MKNIKWIIGSLGVCLFVISLFGIMMFFQISNAEIDLRNQIYAQQKSNETVFDMTWKIIKQQVGIADEYKKAFKEIYPALMEGRYGNKRGGALLSFIQESNPTFEPSLYVKVANSIEAQRTIFTREQRMLIDLNRAHENLLQKFPSSLFLQNRKSIGIQIVTSTKTEQTFQDGKEDL